MRTPRIIAVIVVAGLAAGARARAAGRVVLCDKPAAACERPQRALGSSPLGSWALVDDAALVAAAAQSAGFPPILYRGLRDYDDAVAGLTEKQRADAVLKRSEVISRGQAAQGLGWVGNDLIQLAAAVRDADNGDLNTVLDAALSIYAGSNRFAGATPTVALSQIRDSLAQIVVELPAGPAETAYKKEAEILAEAEVDATHDPRRRIPPFAAPERAYFVSGIAPPSQPDPLLLDKPIYGWRQGVVAMLRPDELTAAPWKDHKPRLLYFGRQAFLSDIVSLTASQIDRRLRARLAGGPPPQELADRCASLAFQHTLLMRQLTTWLRDKRVPWLARWNQAVAADIEGLRLALAAAQPRAAAERAIRLDGLRDDLTVVAALLRNQPDSAENLRRLHEVDALVARLSR